MDFFPSRPPLHPACAAYRPMTEDEMLALIADIRDVGQRDPCVLYQGALLDGKNRWAACETAGCIPAFREFGSEPTDGDDPIRFVLSVHHQRRTQSDSERALTAARMATLLNGQRRFQSQVTAAPSEEGAASVGLSQEEAAKMLRVSMPALQRARVVIQYAPELEDKIYTGEMSLTAAAIEARKRIPKIKLTAVTPATPAKRGGSVSAGRGKAVSAVAPSRPSRAAHPLRGLSREEMGRAPIELSRQQHPDRPEGWTADMAHTLEHGQVQTRAVAEQRRVENRHACVLYWAWLDRHRQEESAPKILERWLELRPSDKRDLALDQLKKIRDDLDLIIAGAELALAEERQSA